LFSVVEGQRALGPVFVDTLTVDRQGNPVRITPPGAAYASDSLAERLAVNRVAIAQQPAGHRVLRRRLNDLLRGPGGRWMLRDIEVNDPPAVMEKDDEDEQDSTCDGRTVKKSIVSCGAGELCVRL
jgi:hypothetical protein